MSQFQEKATTCGGTTRGAFDAEMAHLRAAAWRLGENRPPVRRKSSLMDRHHLWFSPTGERFLAQRSLVSQSSSDPRLLAAIA
jgi:hypothetical protein